jgi:hypothetical protein
MSKLAVSVALMIFTTAAIQAQTTNFAVGANQIGSSGLTFTNHSGQSFSVDQLATQLRTLRTDVDQALPSITAFNESYPASSTGNNSLGGKLSSLISQATGRTGSSNSQTSSTLSNVVTALHGLVSTNSSAAGTTFTANTLKDLVTLQDHLQAIAPILQELNIGTSAGTSAGSQVISSSPYGATNQNNRPLTPTGR